MTFVLFADKALNIIQNKVCTSHLRNKLLRKVTNKTTLECN